MSQYRHQPIPISLALTFLSLSLVGKSVSTPGSTNYLQQVPTPASFLSISGWFDSDSPFPSGASSSHPKSPRGKDATVDNSAAPHSEKSSAEALSCAIVVLLENTHSISILETHITTRPSFTFPHTLIPQNPTQRHNNYTYSNHHHAEYLVLVQLVRVVSSMKNQEDSDTRLGENSTHHKAYQPLCGLRLLNQYNFKKSSFPVEYQTETMTNITIVNSSNISVQNFMDNKRLSHDVKKGKHKKREVQYYHKSPPRCTFATDKFGKITHTAQATTVRSSRLKHHAASNSSTFT